MFVLLGSFLALLRSYEYAYRLLVRRIHTLVRARTEYARSMHTMHSYPYSYAYVQVRTRLD